MTSIDVVAMSDAGPFGRSKAGIVRKMAGVLDWPALYNLWQLPFARPKMDYFFARHEVGVRDAVLDVGCGPGSNTRYFAGCDYLGVDLDENYIRHARHRYSNNNFAVADALTYPRREPNGFDVVLFNGVLHHLDDSRCAGMLRHAAELLSARGHVHVLDMILPDRPSIPHWLARNDRGEFVRPFHRWCDIFANSVTIDQLEQFSVRRFGVRLLDMFYLKARGR